MLVDPRAEVVRVSAEGDAEQLEEAVHAIEQGLRCVRGRVCGRCALEHDHAVRQVRGHDEVVLHHEPSALRVQNEPVTFFLNSYNTISKTVYQLF